MARTSAAVKNRYNNKTYDRMNIVVPKGRKEEIEAFAAAQGDSVNGLVNRLLRDAMGKNETEWKQRETTEE